jgi:3-phenylpropionate/cinnamic acid dioxygenase small subunit
MMMQDRIKSLRQANIYNLHYPRHIVTNVEVLAAHGNAYDVAAAYTVYQTDLDGQTRLFSVGQYLDVIVFGGHEPKFSEKIVVCDTFSIPNLLAIPL